MSKHRAAVPALRIQHAEPYAYLATVLIGLLAMAQVMVGK